MVLTTTAVAFSFSSVGLTVVGFWFYKAFQKIGDQRPGSKIGILLSVLFISIAVQHGILALGGLFFATNTEALYAVITIDIFILSLVSTLSVYLVFYILTPKVSPILSATATFIFGILTTTLIALNHPQPFVNTSNSIDWNMPQWLDTLVYYLLLLNMGPIFIIFAKNFFRAVSRDVKMVSLILMLLNFAGIVNASILFAPILSTIGNTRTKIFDIILGIIGMLFIATFLLIPIIAGWISKHNNT